MLLVLSHAWFFASILAGMRAGKKFPGGERKRGGRGGMGSEGKEGGIRRWRRSNSFQICEAHSHTQHKSSWYACDGLRARGRGRREWGREKEVYTEVV